MEILTLSHTRLGVIKLVENLLKSHNIYCRVYYDKVNDFYNLDYDCEIYDDLVVDKLEDFCLKYNM